MGLFEEVDSTQNSIVQTDRLPKRVQLLATHRSIENKNPDHQSNHEPSLNLNDTEQYKVFDWVRQERLPLFFRTDFFREFKLCKLLTRSLDDERHDSIVSSQLIGGYSRQSRKSFNIIFCYASTFILLLMPHFFASRLKHRCRARRARMSSKRIESPHS